MKKKVFCLTALFFAVFTVNLFSQEVYININPDDFLYPNDSAYIIDMNSDGIDDFEIHFYLEEIMYDIDLWIVGLNGSEIYYEPGTGTDFTGIFDILDTINENMYWGETSHLIYNSGGNWWNAVDKCLGIRLQVSEGYFYGWIRLDGPGYADMLTIKDYGYSTIENQYILAGLPVYYKVDNSEVSDIGNDRNGTDLQVTFAKAMGDNDIIEYRLMAVKTENAESFSAEEALLLPAARYHSIQPSNQSTYVETFEESSLDVDGDIIANLQSYRVFVLSYVDLPDFEGLLSNASQEIMLKTPVENVENINTEDIADYGDGRDLKITFNRISDEATISEYRVYVVDYTDFDSFDRYEAGELTGEYYTAVPPSGQNIEIVLDADSKTVEGLPIGSGGYNIFVMAMTDSVLTDYSGFSGMNEITGLGRPFDKMILAGRVREEATYTDSLISVAGIFPEGGESQNIDFNNDGIDDAVITAYSWSSMAGSGGSASIGSLNNTRLVEVPLDLNTPVDNALTWSFSSGYTSCSTIINSTSCSGEWVGVGPKYLGILIISNNDTIFGWAKLNSDSNGGGDISVDGWAFINVSQLSVSENQIEELRLFPNPATDYVQLELNACDSKNVKVIILDNIGRVVIVKYFSSGNNGLSEIVDVSKLNKGIYFLQVFSNDHKFSPHKLIIW